MNSSGLRRIPEVCQACGGSGLRVTAVRAAPTFIESRASREEGIVPCRYCNGEGLVSRIVIATPENDPATHYRRSSSQ